MRDGSDTPEPAGRGAEDGGSAGTGADEAAEAADGARGSDEGAPSERGADPDADGASRSSADGDVEGAREPDLGETGAGGAGDGAGATPHPDAGTGAPVDDWLRAQEPGTRIPMERIREAGYTPAQAEALREVAARHGVIFGTRTTNIYSTRFIENGTAVPKPVWMKAKTINEWDALIGGPPAQLQGQVGVFEPRPPTPPAPREAYQRFNQRQKEWNKLKPEIERLQAEGLITVEDGVVHKVLDPGPPPVTKPFAGDIDAVVIIREDGSPVSGAEYQRIVEDLKQSGAMLQHGAEANIVSDLIAIKTAGLEPGSFEFAQAEARARRAAEDLFDSLNQNHLDGIEQVIWSGRNGHTVGGPLDELGGWQERIDGRHTDAPPPKFGRVHQEEDDSS
jgi:hypothetical protein